MHAVEVLNLVWVGAIVFVEALGAVLPAPLTARSSGPTRGS